MDYIENRLKFNMTNRVRITKLTENLSSKLKIPNNMQVNDILSEIVDLNAPLK